MEKGGEREGRGGEERRKERKKGEINYRMETILTQLDLPYQGGKPNFSEY